MSEVKGRPYRSPLRQEQAAASRAAVLAAARELFLQQGYAATTIEQVAARAGVSKPTVFTAVGNKQQLFSTVRDVAMAGDDDPTPVAERPSVDRIRSADGIRQAVRETAAHIAALAARYGPVDDVLRGAAAAGDPALRALWHTAQEQRLCGAGFLLDAVLWHGALRPGLDRGRAADLLCLFMTPDVYQQLVVGRGWSPAEYQDWLDRTLADQLLG
jgi:AcrR family transcriptional regulator